MDKATMSPQAIEQLDQMLSEIASLAYQLDRECYYTPAPVVGDNGDPELAELMLDHLRDGICRMGWMADTAARIVGGGMVRGGADEWLLSPSYRSAAKRAADNAGGHING